MFVLSLSGLSEPSVTFRFRMPSSEQEIRKLHMEFGSMYNLERELLAIERESAGPVNLHV